MGIRFFFIIHPNSNGFIPLVVDCSTSPDNPDNCQIFHLFRELFFPTRTVCLAYRTPIKVQS